MPYTYRVVARRVSDGWTLHVGDLGTVVTRSLATAEKDARAHVKTVAGRDDVIVHVQPKLDLHLGGLVWAAKDTNAQLAELTAVAAARSREAAHELRAAGLSNTDIAVVLGVSDQRVSQLFGKNGKKD